MHSLAGAAESSAPSYGTNLVRNGDGEENFGAENATTIVKPTGWETTGEFTVVQYGAKGEFPDNATPGSGHGLTLFEGGNAAVSTATQKIPLDGFAGDCDAGSVTYHLSARMGGWSSLEDNAKVDVTFLDAAGKSLGTGEVGPITAARRLFSTSFVRDDASGTVPKGARAAVVTVTLTRGGSSGYNHAAVDLVSLVLTKG